MNLTDSEILTLRDYAGLLLSISDIAILLSVDEDELREEISNKTSHISKVYRLGKMLTIVELRKQEIDMAKLGSPMAVELTQKYIIEQKLNENG